MAILGSFKKKATKPSPTQPAAPVQPEPEPIAVSEIESSELILLYRDGAAPRLLDCREPFEWAQVRIPGSLHIPMNDIPARLEELDRDAEWVVVCAHGNRSVAVADFLLHHGLRASSLAGGVTDWWMRGGETESDYRR
jgi:rhodanese-related sulfurtransferase